MSFRIRAFIYTMVIVIVAVGVLFAVTQAAIIKQFIGLESQKIQKDAQRVQEVYAKELDTFDRIARNWAEREDNSLYFQNRRFATDLTTSMVTELHSLEIDAVMYFGAKGQWLDGFLINPQTGRLEPVPADFKTLLESYSLFPEDQDTAGSIKGVVNTSGGPLMVSSRVVNNDAAGALSTGLVVFGRYLDTSFIDDLGRLSQLTLEAQAYNATQISVNFQKALVVIKKSPGSIVVEVPQTTALYTSSGSVAAYFSLNDLQNTPLLILRASDAFQFYQQGIKSVRDYGIVLVLIGLICGGASYLYFDRSMISRLLVIDEGLNRFRETRNFDQRIELDGNDELTRLANAFNSTIHEIGQYQDGQIKGERQFREALQNLSLAAVILDPQGRIVFCNDKIIQLSGWNQNDIVGHFWCSLFIPEENQPDCRREILEAARTGRITAHEDAVLVLRNGTTRTFTLSNTLLYAPDEMVTGIVRIGEDVTERRKAEAMLRKSLRETRLHLSRLTALRNIDTTITSTMDTMAKIESVAATIQDSLDVDAVDFLRLDIEDHTLVPIAAKGLSQDFLELQPVQSDDPVIKQMSDYNDPLILVHPHKSQFPPWTKTRVDGSRWIEFYAAAPMISNSKLIGILEVFAKQPVDTDEGWLEHFKSLALQATITIENDEMVQGIQRANHELLQAYEGTLIGWARALELRDKETRGHSERMMDLTMRLGRRLGMDSKALEVIARGVLLHDIGKMGVPDYILHKPGPLTDEEWVVMRQHPQFAYNLLKNIPYLADALDVAYGHHERWDGTGYPRGLHGSDIPFSARIFSVIDVWDALTHDRPYRPAWPEEEALAYIREQAGSQFDPRVVEAFIQLQRDSVLRQTTPLPVHFTLD